MLFRNHTPRKMLTALRRRSGSVLVVLMALLMTCACEREPMLHLHHDGGNTEVQLPVVEVGFEVFWDYEPDYDWRREWHYGWDETDKRIFGEIGYTRPDVFEFLRYYTGNDPSGKHTIIDHEYPFTVYGNRFSRNFNWGYWDLMVWNQIKPHDGIESVHVDYETSLDSVIAYTNNTMFPTRYRTPRFTHSFYQPDELFAAYRENEHIDPNLEGFTWNEDRGVWIKATSMTLRPVTYIYLTQVVLHNNRGRVDGVDGSANLSDMARTVNLNTGAAGLDAITTRYNVRMKKDVSLEADDPTKKADVIGGRMLTFGMCGVNASLIETPKDTRTASMPNGTVLGYTQTGHPLYFKDNEVLVDDGHKHYMDVTMTFSNGLDSTFIFDVTEKVRRRYKGGVITVELDMDTVPIPSRSGGSAFDAVVVPPDSVTFEFEM